MLGNRPIGTTLGQSASLGALALISMASLWATAATSPDDSAVALVFPPWWSRSASLAAALQSGPILSEGGLPFVVIIPNQPSRPATAGAWLELRASSLLGCLTPRTSHDPQS